MAAWEKPPDGGVGSWAMNCRVAEANGSLLPMSMRIGMDPSAGRPHTLLAA